jgi:hypothetical protein
VNERVRRLVAALVLACAAFVSRAPHARAQTSPSVIAILCDPGDRFGRRVAAELEALGFRAVLVDAATAPTSRASLEASARKAGAMAAMRAVPSEHGVEVWIADRVTGKTVLRQVSTDGGAPDPEAALAIRAVELLRASLLEVTLPSAPAGEIAGTDELREMMQLPSYPEPEKTVIPRLRFSLAPGVLASPGGAGVAASLDVGVAWMPSEHVGVAAFAGIPLTRPKVEGAAGSVDLSAVLAGAAVRFLFTTRASTWAPTADLGLMAVWLKSSGTSKTGGDGGDSSAVTAAPFARAGLAFAPGSQLRLRTDLLVGVIGQGVSLRVAGEEMATWGKPFFLGSAGIDFGWF